MSLQETENLKITGRDEGAEMKKRFYKQVLLNWTFIDGQQFWGNIHQVVSHPWLGWVTMFSSLNEKLKLWRLTDLLRSGRVDTDH